MCLTPIKVRNNSKVIYPDSFPRIYRHLPCGVCSECQQQKSNEYLFRSYYEAKDTIDKGGFILFDTLTYDSQHLPTCSKIVKREFNIEVTSDFNDFSCFDRRDITLFLKRLRKRLGSSLSRFLSYYLVSEYGLDDRYTHRPHYHVLFFYKSDNLTPLELSNLISQSWYLGRTDGYPYKSSSYIYSKRVISQANTNYSFLLAYVSKYLIKDSDFVSTLNSRKHSLKSYLSGFDKSYSSFYPGRLYINSVYRNISPFHLQSQGFGSSYLKTFSIDDFKLHNGKVKMPSISLFSSYIKLPLYYYRKLFQYVDFDDFGNKKWFYNSAGIDYILSSSNNSVKSLSLYLENQHKLLTDSQQKYILKLLDGRSYSDYSDYLINKQFRLHDSVTTLDSVSIKKHSIFYDTSRFFRNYSTPSDVFSQGYAYISYHNNNYDYDWFFHDRLINQDYSYSYRNFDDLFIYLHHLSYSDNKKKSAAFYHRQHLTKKVKKNILI